MWSGLSWCSVRVADAVAARHGFPTAVPALGAGRQVRRVGLGCAARYSARRRSLYSARYSGLASRHCRVLSVRQDRHQLSRPLRNSALDAKASAGSHCWHEQHHLPVFVLKSTFPSLPAFRTVPAGASSLGRSKVNPVPRTTGRVCASALVPTLMLPCFLPRRPQALSPWLPSTAAPVPTAATRAHAGSLSVAALV